MFQDIELHDLLKRQKGGSIALVDVRSPQEFAEFHIPGSINIPVFNNEERAEVGTIYKQISPEAAKEKGLEIFFCKAAAVYCRVSITWKRKGCLLLARRDAE